MDLRTVTHHRRQGRVLTQTQEEMLLLGGLALFSLCTHSDLSMFHRHHSDDCTCFTAAFVAYRAFGQREGSNFYENTSQPRYPEVTAHAQVPSRTDIHGGRYMGYEHEHRNNHDHGHGRLSEPRMGQRPPQRVGVQTERPQAGSFENGGWKCPGDAVRCVVEEWTYY